MVINYVNPEHVHTLIDLPAGLTIQDAFRLLKGASSHWINQNRIVKTKFRWGRGYGAFSAKQSMLVRSRLISTSIGSVLRHQTTDIDSRVGLLPQDHAICVI
jgi:REP element-mobilizing transposase RayT